MYFEVIFSHTSMFFQILKRIKRLNFISLCLLLFFIRLPPLYILPWGGSFSTTHSIARYLIAFIVTTSLFYFFLEKKRLEIDKKTSLFILFYFSTQSLSIIKTGNIAEFFLVYKNIIFGLLLFIASLFIVNKKNMYAIITVFLFAGILNLIFAALVYFFPYIVFTYFQPLFHDKFWSFFAYQYERNRFFGDILDEILVPFLFYLFTFQRNIIKKLLLVLYVAFLAFFSILSNWRFKIVILSFSLISSSLLYFHRLKNYLLSFWLAIGIFLLVGYFASIILVGFNTFDRFFLRETKDITNIFSRFSYWSESFEIGLSSPIFGVGLGNYYDNLSSHEQLNNLNSSRDLRSSFPVIYDPHNIFFSVLANTGFLGFLSYTLLILWFMRSDLKSIKKSDILLSSTILVFWSLFSYALFNPAMEFSYQALFWFFRGAIYKLERN